MPILQKKESKVLYSNRMEIDDEEQQQRSIDGIERWYAE